MSGPIQIIPPGLLGFLQLKNGGTNPRDLEENVQPTFELWRHYLNATAEEGTGDSANVVSGTNGFVSFNTNVSNGEWWYIHYFMAQGLGVAAADTLSIAPAFNAQVAAGGISIALAPMVSTSALTVASSPFNVARDVLVPPGAGLGAFVGHVLSAAGNWPLRGRWRFTRLKI